MLPSFCLDVASSDTCVGMQTQQGKYVKKATSRVAFEISAGLAPNANFVSDLGAQTYIVKNDFLIGKCFNS